MLVTFVQEVMRGVKSGFDVYRLAPNTFESKNVMRYNTYNLKYS